MSGVDPGQATAYNSAMVEQSVVKPADCARLVVDVASDKQASDIVMLGIREAADFADYFVILTGESARQMETVPEEIESALKQIGSSRHHREGTPGSGWILLDFGDVIVHLFGPEKREFYGIEHVWSSSLEIVRIQ